MLTGRPKPSLELSAEEAAELRGFCSSRSLPHALVARAKLVLWSAEGKSNTEIAAQLNWTKATVGKWRHYNRNCRPFAWTATADSILQKLAAFVHVSLGQHTRANPPS